MAWGYSSITVAPVSPSSIDRVSIRVFNSFPASASLQSEAISRNGNHFLVEQTFSVACFLPDVPRFLTPFDVGVLPAGTYTIEVRVLQVAGLPDCPTGTRSATAGFSVVAAPLVVPVASPPASMALLLLILLAAMAHAVRGRQFEQ